MAGLQLYRIFLASPGDVAEERQLVREAADELRLILGPHAARLEVQGYETHAAPALGIDPQDAINRQLDPADCEIFLGIMGNRIGTETRRSASGTVEEFERAYRRFQDEGVPRIMFYFKRERAFTELEDIPQLEKALRFRAEVSRRGLVEEYTEVAEFAKLVMRHLAHAARELSDQSQRRIAVEQSPPEEAGAVEDTETDGEWIRPFVDVDDLRLRLEAKLTWLCKHLLAGPDSATFATIGSLRYDGYLTDEQARVATRILTRTPESIIGEQPEDQRRTLEDDTKFVNGFRASVFEGFVRQRIRKLKWSAEPFPQKPGHRPDFFAERDGEPRIRVASRFVLRNDSKILARTVDRLTHRTDDESDEVARRMIVVPDVGAIGTDLEASPQIVRYEDLARALGG